MDFNKAKNITIISFILLNIGLAILLYADSRRYTLSEEQKEAIEIVLNNNNIELSKDFEFINYPPMYSLKMRSINFIQEDKIEVFLVDIEQAFISVEHGDYGTKYILKSDFETLIFETSRITYTNSFKNDKVNLEEAKNIAENILSEVNSTNYKFILDSYYIYGKSNIVLEYRQNYRGKIIYNNYAVFEFNEHGLSNIEIYFKEPLGSAGVEKDIRSPDEVLITFITEIRNIYKYENIIIVNMELIYKFSGDNIQVSSEINALPFYRVYYTIEGDTFDKVNYIIIRA